MKLTLTSDFIHLKGAPSSDKSIFESFHNAAFSKVNGWRIPMNIWSMRELAKTHPALLQDPEFVAYGKKLKDEIDTLLHLRKQAKTAPGDKLRSYQREDVEYLKHIPCAGVFNEPRTGKSAVALTVCKETESKKNCIVCPASLVFNWKTEIEKWDAGTAFVVTGNIKKRMKIYEEYKQASEGYLIISYDTLRSDIDVIESL